MSVALFRQLKQQRQGQAVRNRDMSFPCTAPPKPQGSVQQTFAAPRRPLRVNAAATDILAPRSKPREKQPNVQPRPSAPPLPLPGWLRSEDSPTVPATPAEPEPSTTTAQQPILSFAGGGIFFWCVTAQSARRWQLPAGAAVVLGGHAHLL